MDRKEQSGNARRRLFRELLGGRIPRLWCPPLTHYTGDGGLDTERMEAHWMSMRSYVSTFLLPGSTGDGWEMDDEEIHDLLHTALDMAKRTGVRLMIGVLRTRISEMLHVISGTMDRLRDTYGHSDDMEVLKAGRVCGFTVCPPKGAGLSQNEIRSGLEQILNMGLPISLYQLPQVTENEISPELVMELAGRYSNLILLKDTSGCDHVAEKDRGSSGVFLVRGAEGDYASWLEESDGPYQGLLLSTANVFSGSLHRMITCLEAGEMDEARDLSDRLTGVMRKVFHRVQDLPHGNVFANANKAMDHFMARGPGAEKIPPPMLHAGVRIPAEVIRDVGEILREGNWLPEKGYLEPG
jgi:dihydrodipicolinate synthase/N-acetylneuraminate lyase